VHQASGALHPKTAVLIEEVALLVEARGIDAWFELEPAELLGVDAAQYEKASDTLDVWFDSGVTHACVLAQRDELAFPADLYLEGSDQHRGWFQSSLLTAVAIHGVAPYKAALTHGFTVDVKGQKMSKSIGNTIAPQKVANSLGADVLRLWVASTDYRGEMTMSDEILKRASDAYRRMRNTARFLLANLAGFDPQQHTVAVEQLIALDAWAVQRAQALQQELIAAYDRYEFHLIYQKVHNFCSVDMGSFYLDIIKDRQYTTQENSRARRSAQTAMYHIVEAMARWLAPILSFTAEEMYRYIPGERQSSVFMHTWYEFPALADGQFDLDFWQQVFQVREQVSRELEKARNAGAIGSALDAEVDLYCGDALFQRLQQLQDELHFVLITSEARLHPQAEKSGAAMATELEDLWVQVSASEHGKCVRCWHHKPEVGAEPRHPELCGRCVTNVEGAGEDRRFT